MKKLLVLALISFGFLNAGDTTTTTTTGTTNSGSIYADMARGYAGKAYDTVNKALTGTEEEKAEAKSKITDIWENVKGWFTDLWSKAKEKGSQMMEKMPEGETKKTETTEESETKSE